MVIISPLLKNLEIGVSSEGEVKERGGNPESKSIGPNFEYPDSFTISASRYFNGACDGTCTVLGAMFCPRKRMTRVFPSSLNVVSSASFLCFRSWIKSESFSLFSF